MSKHQRVMEILSEAKKLAIEYRALTGKPLGVTAELAEYEAARLLGLELAPARSPDFDAVERVNGVDRRLQIKGRCLSGKKNGALGAIKRGPDWEALLMVILDEQLEPVTIVEADRAAVLAALDRPGSNARNNRGALQVSKVKSIGKRRWPPKK